MGSMQSFTTEKYPQGGGNADLKRSGFDFDASSGASIGIRPRFDNRPSQGVGAMLAVNPDGSYRGLNYLDPATQLQLPAVNPLAATPNQVYAGQIVEIIHNQVTDLRGDKDYLIPAKLPESSINPRTLAAVIDRRRIPELAKASVPANTSEGMFPNQQLDEYVSGRPQDDEVQFSDITQDSAVEREEAQSPEKPTDAPPMNANRPANPFFDFKNVNQNELWL